MKTLGRKKGLKNHVLGGGERKYKRGKWSDKKKGKQNIN